MAPGQDSQRLAADGQKVCQFQASKKACILGGILTLGPTGRAGKLRPNPTGLSDI